MRPVSINCQPWRLHKDTTKMSSPAWKVSHRKMRDNLTSVASIWFRSQWLRQWHKESEKFYLANRTQQDHPQHAHQHLTYHQAYPIKCLCWQVDCSAAKMSRRHKKRWAGKVSSKKSKRDPNILSCAWVCIQLAVDLLVRSTWGILFWIPRRPIR